MKGLFGQELGDEVPKTGHAATPGTGPEGMTCGQCRHYYRRQLGKVYRKCWLSRHRWTGGPGTDIKAGDPACAKFETGQGRTGNA